MTAPNHKPTPPAQRPNQQPTAPRATTRPDHEGPPKQAEKTPSFTIVGRTVRLAGLVLIEAAPAAHALGLFFEDNAAALIRPAPKAPHGLALQPLTGPPEFAATLRNLAGHKITAAQPTAPGTLEITTEEGLRLTLTATDAGRQLDVWLIGPAGPDHGPPPLAAAVREMIATAAAMRDAQRLYFQTRAPGPLQESKRLEKRLDAALAALHSQPVYVGPTQRQLFDE